MQIVCPNCGTSYGVEASALGPTGRAVRCVRCRETWHARIEDVVRADALVQAAEEIGRNPSTGNDAADWDTALAESAEHEVPHMESPPLAQDGPPSTAQDWAAEAQDDLPAPAHPLQARFARSRQFAFGSGPARAFRFSPPIAIAAMAALTLALVIWRTDVVRLLPQTATFFQLTGLGVNLRNLAFEDVRVSTETVDGNLVFVIEGAVRATSRKAIEIPRLRFLVQDAHGADIYAWNSVVDQATIQPGEKVAFRSRLASPPAGAQNVVVRFFHRRDLASGNV